MHVGWLTAVWVLLWGRLSVANVVGGALVSLALLAVFPLEARPGDRRVVVRPFAALRLVGHVLVQLVTSNAAMSAQIVRVRPHLHPGVVRCPLRTRSDGVVTMVADVLAFGPGTMVVDVECPDAPGAATLLVHVLRVDETDRVRRAVARLEELVVAAFGSADEVAACRASPADGAVPEAPGAP